MTCYIVVFRLEKEKTIRVGALGEMGFKPGYYAYVGSAKRNLAKRIERHASKNKKLHWHIDYFSVEAQYVTARLSAQGECELAGEVHGKGGKPVPRFGCSDCSCRSHLFFFETFPQAIIA